MPRNVCCVPGCSIVASDGVPLHYFPNPETFAEKFQAWVKNIGGDIASVDSATILRTRRICRRHFETQFLYPNNRLSKLAVPTLLLPSGYISAATTSPLVPDCQPSTSRETLLSNPVIELSTTIKAVENKLASVPTPSNWSSLPSNSPSSFTEDCGLNKDMSEEECTTTLFCICCLNSEIPYINLSTCSHGDFLNSFVMPEMHLKDQVVCYQCHSTLKKIKLFKLQIEKSFKILADSVVKNAKSGKKSSTLQTSQLFTIDISPKLYKRKLQTKEGEDPQSKQKKADKDNLILEEIPKTNITESPQTITEHAKISIEKGSLPVIDKKSKNIEDALKIININQNSGCIKNNGSHPYINLDEIKFLRL